MTLLKVWFTHSFVCVPKGGVSSSVTLTAFVAAALMEAGMKGTVRLVQ